MLLKEEDIREEAVLAAAKHILGVVRTAPKTRGVDNLVVMLAAGADIEAIAAAMDEEAKEPSGRRAHFARDADNLRASQALVLVGAKNRPAGLDCGWCGFPSCGEKAAAMPKAPCAFAAMDLGIGIGSLVATAADLRLDNRVMYSAGYSAVKMALFPEDIGLALAVPLAVAGKSPFFDRKWAKK